MVEAVKNFILQFVRTSRENMSENKGKACNVSFFTPEQGNALLRLARQAITDKLAPARKIDGFPDAPMDDEAYRCHRGTFVTLKHRGNLRGCIGSIGASQDVLSGVRENALHAAFQDNRFSSLTPEELDEITIEVTVLTEARPLDYRDAADLAAKLRPNVDGVILRKGEKGATFLPQVWEQLPDIEDFLANLCRKAGLQPDAWKKERLKILTYQVQCFEEAGAPSASN